MHCAEKGTGKDGTNNYLPRKNSIQCCSTVPCFAAYIVPNRLFFLGVGNESRVRGCAIAELSYRLG